MLSVVKKVRPIKPGDLQSPYPIDMLASAWVLGIANPQSIKRLGQFLTADCKSAGTPNGGKAYPALRNPQSIKRLGHFLTADCKSAGTPNGGRTYPALRMGISGAMDAMEAMLSEQHHYLHVPFLIRPKVTERTDYQQLS